MRVISHDLLQLQLKRSFFSSQNPLSITNPFHTSKLLDWYFKRGRVEDARKLFEEIPHKNSVSWSIMIYGYAENGFHREALNMFSQMRVSGWIPNSFTMVGVLVGLKGLQDPVAGTSLHGLIVKTGLESNLIVGTAMLHTYAKCGNIRDSYKFFQLMNNPSLVTCNAMIGGLIHNELFEEAFAVFNQLQLFGLWPNSVTMLSIIQACIALGTLILSESIHSMVVKRGLCSDVALANSVLNMYSCLEDLEAATKFFTHMESSDIISWTTMIGLLVRTEYAHEALNLFCRMGCSGFNLDTTVLMNLVRACALLGDLKMGKLIHAQSIVNGFGCDIPLSNSIIAMYAKCGDVYSSANVFNQMLEKSLISWTVMISGYVQNGGSMDALNLLAKMRLEEDFNIDPMMLASLLTACGEIAGLEPCKQLHGHVFNAGFAQDRLVQNSLVSAYAKCGFVELAYRVFEEMLCRDIVSWNTIISGYGINGHGEDAIALFKEMQRGEENPDGITYLSVLSACDHSGLVDDGLMIFKQMVEEKRIRPTAEHCGCVVDMLARAGHLSEASAFTSIFSDGGGSNIWRALLGGCCIHSKTMLAKLAADKVFELESEGSSHAVLLSNIYASVGRYEDAEVLRLNMTRKGLIKNPGMSFLVGFRPDFG